MSGDSKAVFLDRSGRRALRLRIAAALVAVFALTLLGLFAASVTAEPHLTAFGPAAVRQPMLPHHSAKRLAAARKVLFAHIADRRRARIPTPRISEASEIRGAYFAPWRLNGMEAFRAHAGELTHIYPAWLTLAGDGRSIDAASWRPDRQQTTRDLVTIARTNGVRVIPVLSNAQDGAFDPVRLRRMLADPPAQTAVIDQLANFIKSNGYAGLQVDFELLDPTIAAGLAPWMSRLAARLHGQGEELSIALETSLSTTNAKGLAASADYGVVMAYDEHESSGPPGPVESARYVEEMLDRFTPAIGANRLVLGIGAYGYDWNVTGGSAEAITNQQAIALAARYRGAERPQDAIDFDDEALNPTFQYRDDQKQLHEVWFLDAVTAQNALTLARARQVRGAALWALGMEDPSTWAVMGRQTSSTPDLRSVVVPAQVSFIGDGELLRVLRHPQAGSRTYEIDHGTGLITDESYTAYPSGWLVERSGAPEKTIALTFDDGPDPTWTPQILEVLKRQGVKATFFMIGQLAADHPDLVRRVYAEGHEIGNHSFTHPNMAHVSEERVRLELSATQRAFEAVLGRSAVLFRPPFNADSEPRSYGEIMPIAVAASQGYLTAGETIDPNDWDIWRRAPDGSRRRLTGLDIARDVVAKADNGQAVLLHDGGGDRSATLASLEGLISGLKARGYRFSTIGGLENRSRDDTMPLLPASERTTARLDAVVFTARRVFSAVLFWGFVLAVGLGLARIALMIGLAARPARERPPLLTAPRVDVLVAAFNEAGVITRTIRSLLDSIDVDVRVIVVDDGSTDGTGDVVEAEFGSEARVRLGRKVNGGKASALNLALSMADAAVVVGVDADTQLDPDALALLVRWFEDPAVGAAAGNVKVGNRRNIVTRWQSLEYITSQNVDRRAMSRLNAITVVPGAIGAYRASALRALGGYRSDTLAEDMDLTWRLRRAGWVIVNERDARAYTEAPETLGALMRQRFRWTFGTLQCLWKHRSALFRYGWFGGLALPTLWLFQFAAQVLAPFVDLQIVVAIVARVLAWIASVEHADVQLAPDPTLWLVVAIYIAFLGLEIAAGAVAYAFDREDPRELWLLPTQRFVYRQLMYIVVWRALLRATGGVGSGWGKLKRTGGVVMREPRAG